MRILPRNASLPLLLFCGLFVLLLAKFFWPGYSIAQQAPPTPVPPAAAADGSSVTPACAQQSVPVVEYIAPDCGGADCPPVVSTAVAGGDRNIGNVNNQIVALNSGGTVAGRVFKQQSNEIHFLYTVDGGFIKFLQDTTWGGQFCTDGRKAFYRVFQGTDINSSSWGGNQYLTNMTCGQTHSNQQFIRGYAKEGSDIDNSPFANVDSLQCSVTGQTLIPTSNSNRLIFQGPAICNGVEFDIVSLVNTGGAGAGEVYFYCKGVGLCAFYDRLDFSIPENQPINWTAETDVCDLKGTRPQSDYFEHNIQRADSQSMLNNFLDEYSATCMPKNSYVLGLSNPMECARTAKGCDNWNATAELTIDADGKLFGLFRDEEKAVARSQEPKTEFRDRMESIEAYFSARVPNTNGSSAVPITGNNQADPGLILNQAPAFSLTTLPQQCEFIYDKLKAVNELCKAENRIEGDATGCAIDETVKVGNKEATNIELFEKMGSNPNCKALMDPAENDTIGNDLRDLILAVDPSMEMAYRPAFVVMVTKTDGNDPSKNPKFRSQGDGDAFWQVDYLEVKVPVFGSDFLEPGSDKSTSANNIEARSYHDPLRITADILHTPKEQKQFIEDEERDRNAMRGLAAQLGSPGSPGSVVGAEDLPIKCRSANDTYGECDTVAKSLISFINASAAVATPDNTNSVRQYNPAWSVACQANEEDFYPNKFNDSKEDRIAEVANTIGSDLASRDVGIYEKKTTAKAEVEQNVNDINGPLGPSVGTTQLFFVTPHYYNLIYAQESFLSFLDLDQRVAAFRSNNFNAVLKTGDIDSYKNAGESQRVLRAGTPTPTTRPGVNPPLVETGQTVSIELNRDKFEGEDRRNPLMWQMAGSIANAPTRLLTLVYGDQTSDFYEFTLRCTGETATEDWLLGKCNTPYVPNPIPEASIPPDEVSCVEVWMKDKDGKTAAERRQEFAERINTYLPKQETKYLNPTTGYKFGGWRAYFSAQAGTQHLFMSSCTGNRLCYEYILNRIMNETDLNPYLAIAIALNETGGLISTRSNFAGRHFGCGVDPTGVDVISTSTIEEKLSCMIGAFNNYKAQGKSDNEALTTYGYSLGYNNRNLRKIIGILSEDTYQGVCN